MQRVAALLVACLSAGSPHLGRARLVHDAARDAEAKQYPVSKVVTLLRDMQKELEKEADGDEEVFDKMDCWCKTNDKDKSQSIKDAEARIAELTTTIETSAANSARLKTEIQSHETELTRSQQSLDQATALREQELAQFNSEEKDMLQSIQALDAALVVLAKHARGGAAFLDDGALGGAMAAAREQMQTHLRLLRGVITPHQRKLVLAFRQDPYAGQTPTFRQAYQPQSSEIVGIIRQMKETFETNLAETQKEEMEKQKSYEGLKAAKEEEIRATKDTIDQKKIQLAETDQKHAQAKQDIEDTRQSFSTDDTFLITLKEKCAATRAEYEVRKKTRDAEIAAVAEAISILSADEARDTFSKTFNPASLIQRRQLAQSSPGGQKSEHHVKEVSALLSKVAAKVSDPRLAALAVAARADPLAKVKEAINKLITELTVEKKEEIKKKDDCVARSHQNELSTERYRREKADLAAKADGLKATISELDAAVKTLSSEIADLQLQMKRKGEDRELENKDFQSTLADQRETQKLLHKALVVLKKVYEQKEVASGTPGFVQVGASQEPPPPPPPGFGEYGQGRAAGGVLGLIETIIRDAESMEKEVINDEQSAQKEYEAFVQDTNSAIQSKQKGIIHKNATKSQAEQELITAEDDSRAATTELETLLNTADAIKLDCDFIVKNFDIRQEARDQEIEALEQAKAVLAGMKLEM